MWDTVPLHVEEGRLEFKIDETVINPVAEGNDARIVGEAFQYNRSKIIHFVVSKDCRDG